MNHKQIFSANLNKVMEDAGKTRRDISEALGFSYYTVTDWVKGKKMPRMDKVEMLAKYFNCLISDLIEEHSNSNSTKTISITEGEQKLLDLFRKVPESQQQMVLQMITVALKSIE